MLPLLVIFVAVYFRGIYAVIENRCCCGCPLTPCPVELKEECPDSTLPCSIYQPNSTFPMVDCRVLLGVSTNTDKEYEFVPIGKDIFRQEFTTTTTTLDKLTMTPNQDVGARKPLMEPSPLLRPLIQPTITGMPNNIPRALSPPPTHSSNYPPYGGLGYELGNMLGRVIDSVRDLVGVTLANAIPQPILLTNR